MALRRPGSSSRTTFLITSFWALAMIAVLVGGHLVFGFLIYSSLTGDGGMAEIAAFTKLPTWLLWLSMVAAAVLDGWIMFHKRKDRKKALQR